MTDRTTLEAMLARVLEGTGPDRELDAEIWTASERGASDLAAPPWRYLGGGCWNDDSEPHGHNKVYAPHYTASLDAAMTLVPKRWGWTVFDADPVRRNPPGAFLVDNTYLPPDDPFEYDRPVVEASATTPPRAIIAVCLKARMEAQGE